jgi:hypothetical protein
MTTHPTSATVRSNSSRLADRMDVTCARLYATYDRFWRDPGLEDRVPAFFVLMHQIVRASVPLMEFARSVCVTDNADAVSRQLGDYLRVHIAEERHHDVWLLDDLAAAGICEDQVLGTIPPRSVAALVGAQYYWARHFHPVAMVGYMRLLEGNPPSDAHIERLRLASNLPAEAFRTYRLHGSADPDHCRDIDELLDRLPLSESQLQLIWLSASHTGAALSDCLDDIVRECSRRGDRTPILGVSSVTRG